MVLIVINAVLWIVSLIPYGYLFLKIADAYCNGTYDGWYDGGSWYYGTEAAWVVFKGAMAFGYFLLFIPSVIALIFTIIIVIKIFRDRKTNRAAIT